MGYLVRCPRCRYPKRVDAVEDYDLTGCANALCSCAFLTNRTGWTSPPITLLYGTGRRLVTYDVYMEHIAARERSAVDLLSGIDLGFDDRTVISTWMHNGTRLQHVRTYDVET